MFSTLAYENKKEKKGNQPNHDLDKETYIARDTWMTSLENWGGGLKIFCGYVHAPIHSTHHCSSGCVGMYSSHPTHIDNLGSAREC